MTPLNAYYLVCLDTRDFLPIVPPGPDSRVNESQQLRSEDTKAHV